MSLNILRREHINMKSKIDWENAEELPVNKPSPIDWGQEEEHMPSANENYGRLSDLIKGGTLGSIQGLSNLGASIAHAPSSLYELFKGRQLYETPRPDFTKYYPSSVLGKNAAETGEVIAPLAIPGIGVGGDVVRGLGSLYKGARSLPLTAKMAAKPLEWAKKIAEEKGVSNIKIPNDMLREAKEYFPKSAPYKKLIESAKKGNYQDLFTLQSDLGKVSRQLTRSPSGAERLHGGAASDLRVRWIEAMKDSLRKKGHNDIADLMSKGQKNFSTFKKLEKNVYPKLKKAGIYTLAATGIPTTVHTAEKFLFPD